MSSSTAATITEYFAAIRSLDTERYLSVFAPEGVAHDPVCTPPSIGPEALRAFFSGLGSIFESLNLTETGVFINGNSAAVKWDGAGVGKNGKHVAFEGVDVIDCNDEGKIVLIRAFWDPAPVMAAVQS